MLQRDAIQVLHGDERLTVLIVDFVNRADVGMVESGRGARFALETAEGLRILGDFVGKKLKRDEAAEFQVFGFVDHAHAAAAKLFDDAVVRDGLANHGGLSRFILRTGNAGVNEYRGLRPGSRREAKIFNHEGQRRMGLLGSRPAAELDDVTAVAFGRASGGQLFELLEGFAFSGDFLAKLAAGFGFAVESLRDRSRAAHLA